MLITLASVPCTLSKSLIALTLDVNLDTLQGDIMAKLDFNNIVVRHNGRTISIAQHWQETEDGDFLDTQEILDLGTSGSDYDGDPIRFDGTVDGLINALQAIKMEVAQ